MDDQKESQPEGVLKDLEQAEQEKFAHWLFAQKFEFLLGVAELNQLPASCLPEVAFVGRSNVGKSSLINALTRRKDLARTSNTPGRTQQINFFRVENHLMIADLPGYGYAKASKSDVKKWNELIRLYLQGRPELKRAYLLIDARHGLKKNDAEIMDMLDKCAVSYQIVLTKMDKIKKSEGDLLIGETLDAIKRRPASYPTLIATSSTKAEGIESLRNAISTLAIRR